MSANAKPDRKQIYQRLNASPLPEALRDLFIEDLGWGNPGGLPTREVPLKHPRENRVKVEPLAQLGDVPVFLIRWPEAKLPSATARRALYRHLAPAHHYHLACYVTEDQKRAAFVWARPLGEGSSELRTLPFEQNSPAYTTPDRLSHLAFSCEELDAEGRAPLQEVRKRLDEAFDVQKVTETFFQEFLRVFRELERILREQHDDPTWAHDQALQTLGRIMFLYFVQKKGWLDDNPNFLRDFWRAYKDNKQQDHTFFDHWLSVLFFDAFNNTFHNGMTYFPQKLQNAMMLFPRLNGGLYCRNKLDDMYPFTIPDEFFAKLFDNFEGSEPGFFERYNFTVSETTPLDLEVAVDPEMIGKIYENLVNVESERLAESDTRAELGIFYTPRVEIDLMCRLALVDALANRLGQDCRPLLYEAVFAKDPEEKEKADKALAERNLWPALDRHLKQIRVCDPACGSGSFLVGMLLVLDDLQARAERQLGTEERPYERRQRIIREQLYGVDAMDWAVHVAELRLWLQLVIETDLTRAELRLQPLLPNLSFKIRQGDSLVQEVADIDLGLHRDRSIELDPSIKGKITEFVARKRKFFQGRSTEKEEDLKRGERQLFMEILEARGKKLSEELKALRRRLEQQQGQLYQGQELEREKTADKQLENRIHDLQRLLHEIEALHRRLSANEPVPFVWYIAFVEVFEGDTKGFDIVIGNPPYVRQEMIAAPLREAAEFGGESSEAWKQHKKNYKERLQRSVAAAWPKFFQYKPGSAKFRKLDGKSDLYVYFYFHALSLLNPQGSFCFITSNSWLDVGYGADLQEFLLKHSHVKLILDNEVKRSFAQADVNTVIVLLAPPDDRSEDGLSKTARFVIFKKPFEELARAEVFKAIEAVTDRQSTRHYRITARLQRELLEEGLESETDEESPAPQKRTSHGPLIKTARYIGNKWGGKYLRAPDIFFTILEKGKGKLVRLGDIAEVRRGFTTGANDFFYLEPTGKPAPAGYLHVRNGAGWEGEIEEEFLKPVIKSPRECRSILIKPEDLHYKIFMCHRDKSELQGTAALEYIRWGETQRYHERPSCRGRQRWWDVGIRQFPNIVWVKSVNESHRQGLIPFDALVDQRLYEVTYKDSFYLNLSLNSTITILMKELSGRVNLGEGVLDTAVYEANDILVLTPSWLAGEGREHLQEVFDVMRKRDILPVLDEIQWPDRRALDEVVFDVLGLTAGEREAVYEAVVNLVRARLEKARSV
jgi:type I restriction-modification system DNA methylase subunit